jgi:two-component system, cell cycle response regulator
VVNDEHGHPAGDKVLQVVSALVGASARKQDLAARYGGEEIALILPGVSRTTAAAVAENIRRAIAAKPVSPSAGVNIAVTASIGVATFEPTGPLKEPAHLIKAADLALYAAKHSGRNCVRVFTLSKSPATPAAA